MCIKWLTAILLKTELKYSMKVQFKTRALCDYSQLLLYWLSLEHKREKLRQCLKTYGDMSK